MKNAGGEHSVGKRHHKEKIEAVFEVLLRLTKREGNTLVEYAMHMNRYWHTKKCPWGS